MGHYDQTLDEWAAGIKPIAPTLTFVPENEDLPFNEQVFTNEYEEGDNVTVTATELPTGALLRYQSGYYLKVGEEDFRRYHLR